MKLQYLLIFSMSILITGCRSMLTEAKVSAQHSCTFLPSYSGTCRARGYRIGLLYIENGREQDMYLQLEYDPNAFPRLTALRVAKNHEAWTNVTSVKDVDSIISVLEQASISPAFENYDRAWSFMLNALAEFSERASTESTNTSDSNQNGGNNDWREERIRSKFAGSFRRYVGEYLVGSNHESLRRSVLGSLELLREWVQAKKDR